MSDKKHNKLIIPKIKATPSSPSPNRHNKKTTPELKPKTQNQFLNQIPEFTPRKTFPKQEDLQKMPKLQLAQTYQEQFLHLRRENQVLEKQLGFVRLQRDQLYKRYNELKVIILCNHKEQQKNSDDERPKRQRRVATDIERNYRCPVESCDKSYGSQGSLIQHIKIKHQEFYNTQKYYTYLNRKNFDVNNERAIV